MPTDSLHEFFVKAVTDRIMEDVQRLYSVFFPKIQKIIPQISLVHELDLDGLLLLGQQNNWRVKNIMGNLGIDAHVAFDHFKCKAVDEVENVQILRAIFKQYTELLITGTIRCDPDGRLDQDIAMSRKLPVRLIITRKDALTMKGRLVGRGDKEVPGRDYDPQSLLYAQSSYP